MREDWIECKFGDIITFKNGYAFKSTAYLKGGIPVIRIGDIKENEVLIENAICVDENEDLKEYEIVKDDILIAMSGATTGKFGRYNLTEKAYLNQRVGNIKPISDKYIYKSFLFYLLSQLKREIERSAYGGAQPNISSKKIEELDVTFAPLPEQRAIVKKLESLFSSLDAGVADLKKAQQQLKIYRQAVLKKAFEGELTKEWREKQSSLTSKEDVLKVIKEKRNIYFEVQQKEWELLNEEWAKEGKKDKRPATLRKLKYFENEAPSQDGFYLNEKIGNIYEVFIGSTPSRSNSDYWTNGSINWVSSGEVSFNRIKSTKETISKIGYLNCSTTIHPKGTVMLAMIGEGKTRGQASILEIDACHNQNTAAIRQIDGLTKSEYLYYFLYYNYQKSRGIGSGNNQKALNQEVINNMIIPFCLLEEQNEIVKQIESRLSVCESIEQNIKESLEKAEALRQSILKKAFEGNLLTAQELAECKLAEDYEPAGVLLKQIKAEQKQAIKPKKKLKE